MATFWERVAHSVNRVFSLLCLFVALVVSHFGVESKTLVMIASVPGHCLPSTFHHDQPAYISFFITVFMYSSFLY